MAATPPPPSSVSVPMPAAAPAADAHPEKQLSRFVLCVAFAEWAGYAFGALACVSATGVLLGGFCSSLNSQDFWFASVMIFIEAFRIFSRSYKLDSQSLFGTTRALRWINSSFLGMLGRPQEGNAVVLILGLWLNLINNFLSETIRYKWEIFIIFQSVLTMAVFVTWIRHPRRPQQWQIRAAGIAYALATAKKIREVLVLNICTTLPQETPAPHLLFCMLPLIIEDVAVLLVNLRPRRIANLTSTTCGRKLVTLVKIISALWLVFNGPLIMLWNLYDSIRLPLYVKGGFCEPFALLVLSLGSLQNHAQGSRWSRTDAIMHISYLFYSVVSVQMSVVYLNVTGLSDRSADGLSCLLLLVLLLSGNLQIPAAIAQIVLSSLRLRKLLLVAHTDYARPPMESGTNMVAAIAVFYVLALCQGSLYIVASFLGLLSRFPRRWLMRRSKFCGKLGAKAIHLYYEHAYTTRMEMGMFSAAVRSTGSFADFAIESLSSSGTRDLQVAGLCVLHNMLQEHKRDYNSKDLTLRVTSSSTVVSTLVGMLAWTDMEDDDSYPIIRLLAATVIVELASSLRISSVPGMLKLVSSLLKLAENADAVVLVSNQQGQGHQQTPLAIANGGSVQFAQGGALGPSTGFDSPNLISKTIGIIGLATSDKEQDDAPVCSSLEFLRTGERIGASLRHELWNHPFLLTCLARVLEDDHSSSTPHHIWEPAMDITAKLALDMEAGLEIGRIQVITACISWATRINQHVL